MKRILLVLAVLCCGCSTTQAEDVLFFGNSFTSANDIPKMVEAIAESKGKKAATVRLTKGGQDFAYHLKHSLTLTTATAKSWDFVILQDQSQAATHVRKVDDFLNNGLQLADRMAERSPSAKIVLYETWSYAADHACFKATDKGPAQFTGPDQMLGEIQKNYAALQAKLQAENKGRAVLLAPVGAAFARCVREHPEIDLYADDRKHPSIAGSYLSALVLYATLFNDSPVGAAPCKKVDPKEAKVLQEVAAKTMQAQRESKPPSLK